MLDLLVRHQSGERDQVDGLILPLLGAVPARGLGHRFDAIADDREVLSRHAQLGEFLRRGLRDRDPAVAAVDQRGDLGFHEPADPGEHRARDGPLLAVAVVGEHHGGGPGDEGGEEGHTVLGIDDHVRGAHLADRADPQAEPGRQQRQQRAGVDAQVSPGAGELEPVAVALDVLGFLRSRVVSGAVNHLVTLGGEVLPHLFEVVLRTTALRVVGVAPAQQNYFQGTTHCASHPTRIRPQALLVMSQFLP